MHHRLTSAALLLTLTLGGTGAGAQEASPDFRWQKRLSPGQLVQLRNINGHITVAASSGDQVEVVGVRRGSRRDDDMVRAEVVETSDGVVICAIKDGLRCSEDGISGGSRREWSDERMDLEVRLPRSLEVSASSVSGHVRITGAEGRVRAKSVSGEVRLAALRSSEVHARSVSGDVEVSIDALTGTGALEFGSVSGDVTLALPRGLDADVELSTVSGEFESGLPITLNGRVGRRSMSGRIGRGGRRLKLSTVSGDVRIRER